MKQGFSVTQVSCATCGVMLTFQPNFAETVEEVEKMAVGAHSGTKLICTAPQLVVNFILAMASDGMFEPEKSIVATNGRQVH